MIIAIFPTAINLLIYRHPQLFASHTEKVVHVRPVPFTYLSLPRPVTLLLVVSSYLRGSCVALFKLHFVPQNIFFLLFPFLFLIEFDCFDCFVGEVGLVLSPVSVCLRDIWKSVSFFFSVFFSSRQHC